MCSVCEAVAEARDDAAAEIGILRRDLADALARGDAWRDKFNADTDTIKSLTAVRDAAREVAADMYVRGDNGANGAVLARLYAAVSAHDEVNAVET